MLKPKIFNIFGVNKKAISRVYFYPVGSSLSLKSVCPSLDSLRPGSGSGPCRWSKDRGHEDSGGWVRGLRPARVSVVRTARGQGQVSGQRCQVPGEPEEREGDHLTSRHTVSEDQRTCPALKGTQ